MKTPKEILMAKFGKDLSHDEHPCFNTAPQVFYDVMEEYANQYLELLIKIIKAREGAQTTQDLYKVLTEIELAITILKLKS